MFSSLRSLGCLFAVLMTASAAAVDTGMIEKRDNTTNPNLPTKWGFLLFPGFQALDVFGPLDMLNILSWEKNISLSLISASMEPVTTKTKMTKGDFEQLIVPTHTLENAPEDLDVLMIPGGSGTRVTDAAMNQTIAYIAKTFPNLQYLFTVCTGSALAAKAGVLDGKRATSNKNAWEWVISQGPNVNWVSHARWVQDGNVWTTSGVSAGIDGAYAFVSSIYGDAQSQKLAVASEHIRQLNSTYDPFADYYNLTRTGDL